MRFFRVVGVFRGSPDFAACDWLWSSRVRWPRVQTRGTLSKRMYQAPEERRNGVQRRSKH